MLEIIDPSTIICYGEKFERMEGNIIEISPFDIKMLVNKLGIHTFLKKYQDGTLYPTR